MSETTNQQKIDQQQDLSKSCIFGISNDGLILGGVNIPWLGILIVILAVLWILNNNGSIKLPFAHQTANISVPVPVEAPMSGGFKFNLAPSLPRGDVAKLFNHDTW